MNTYLIYGILFAALIALEFIYFRLADHFNIIDKPNERSSHSKVVLRGGGVIFTLGFWLWSAFFGFRYPWALAASLGFIYLCPDSVLAHWIYLLGAAAVLCAAYVLFMKKHYHLHEAYLKGLKGE